jgi:UDP-N-acetylglucosamine transferase subunit ALG13
MNFLVLTGTTGFKILEDSIADLVTRYGYEKLQFTLQTKNSIVALPGIEHVEYVDLNDIDVACYDGIIGHCGAGTTFWALEKKVPYMAVVDLTRLDKHQEDLGMWLLKNNYACVIQSRELVLGDLDTLLTHQLSTYIKDEFKTSLLMKVIKSL